MIRRILFVLLAAFFLPQLAQAQEQSEDGVLKQTITGTEITIEYSRPSVRGRVLFGELEKWGHVWTPGANMATTIKFSKDVKLNGTDIEAGNYSMWFHLVEAGPWELMLHPDTTKGHLPAPPMSEAYATIEISPEQKADFTETLTWNVEHVRATGGILEFQWGNTRVPIEIGVDLGYEFTFERSAVEPYLGDWLLDRSMSRPPDSTIAEMMERNAENATRFLAYYDTKEENTLVFSDESGMVIVESPWDEETLAYFEENKIDPEFYQRILIRKSRGIFSQGTLMNGELAGASSWSFMEFEFDENGQANIWVERDAKTDEILSRAVRINK